MYQIILMKKIYFLLFILFAGHIVNAQSNQPCVPCLPYGITFETQNQIDSFQINYPGCTDIVGHLTIHGSDITNIIGLDVLTSVGGIWIQDSVLINLTGLDNLKSIGNDGLAIYECKILTSLSALGNLNFIGGYLVIVGNDALKSLTGLENLVSIGESIDICANNSLTSLTGLSNVTSIESYLYISNNNALTSLTGLENLTSIGFYLGIYNNHALKSLTGLDSIDGGTISDLFIIQNDSLSTCDVKSICDYLASPNGPIDIRDNAVGCNNAEEVKDSCGITYIESVTLESPLTIYPNPTSTTITIETQAKGFLSINNTSGQQLLQQIITAPTTTIDVSGLNSGVYVVKAFGEKEVQVGKFIKQ